MIVHRDNEITITYEGILVEISRYIDDERDIDGYLVRVEGGPPMITETRPHDLVVGERYRVVVETTSASFERATPVG